MRRCRASLLLLTIGISSPASAQQVSTPSGKKADSQAANISLPARSAENWQGLTDLKSGLDPRPPVTVQGDEQPEFVREMIRLQWRNNDPIEVWVIRPKVAGKVPERSLSSCTFTAIPILPTVFVTTAGAGAPPPMVSQPSAS